jgi:2-keto-3-deoxy-L-rhamnonate aldolase RhmA
MTTLKSKLLGQGHAFGPMLMEFFSPGMPAIIAATGADFALFDMEHTGASLETMKAMVAGCRGLGLAPLVRVPRGEYHFIARALDIGAHGIMVPMVGSAAEAAAFASAAHYPPAGRRGAGFGKHAVHGLLSPFSRRIRPAYFRSLAKLLRRSAGRPALAQGAGGVHRRPHPRAQIR